MPKPKGEPTEVISIRVKKSTIWRFFKEKKPKINKSVWIAELIEQTPEYQRWLAKKQTDDKTPALF